MTPKTDMERDPQLTAGYRAGAREEPPAHLDAALRAAARREVGAGPGSAGAARFRNWGVPVSLAAVVVLSATVVMMMREEGADRFEPGVSPVPVEMAPQVKPDLAERRDARPPVAAAKAPSFPSASMPSEATKTEVGKATEPAPQRAAAAPRAKIAAGAVASVEDDAAGRRERLESAPAAPRPMLRTVPSATGESAAAQSAAPVAAMADALAKAALWQDLIHEPPNLWVRRIAELRRTGKTADADALSAEFRRRFPAERLPDDLR